MKIRDLVRFTGPLPEDQEIAIAHVKRTGDALLQLYDKHVIDGYDGGSEEIAGISDPTLDKQILDAVCSPDSDIAAIADRIMHHQETFGGAKPSTLAYVVRRNFVKAMKGTLRSAPRTEYLLGGYRLLGELLKQTIQK